MHNRYYSPRTFRFFTIIIMVVLCLILNTLTKINFNKIELPKNQPEYNATGAVGKIYNGNGQLIYQMMSGSAWKFPHDDRVYMQDIHAFMYTESTGAVKYEVNSNDGWINFNAQIGLLGKNSVLIVANKVPKQVITIYGSQVHIDLAKNYIYSSEDVKAVEDQKVVSGHGFTYDVKTQFLKLGGAQSGAVIPPGAKPNARVKVIYE